MHQEEMSLRRSEPIRAFFERIFTEASNTTEQGRWFEDLFMETASQVPDFQVAEIWRWRNWPDREELTDLDGRDIGIDLVAKLTDGTCVAIQCKCYSKNHRVSKADIDSFINEANRKVFDLLWVVSTCDWSATAEQTIKNRDFEIRRIDFLNYLDHTILEIGKPETPRAPKPLQHEAIEAIHDGLGTQGNDRGKLIMACGTGKTFTSLRAAEKLVPDNGCILFAAPTISLVSQARCEWLTHTIRPMSSRVVCSDQTAGGRGERQQVGPDDLSCPVTSDAREIAKHLSDSDSLNVVFCTYHSLHRVIAAQQEYGAPVFDLAIADEAHRTTGIDNTDRKVNFQDFHNNERLRANKRLYMTATERIYTAASKARHSKHDLKVIDMSDIDVYGPLLHQVKFKDAVEAGELVDYRVIVLGVHEGYLTPGIRSALQDDAASKARVDDSDLARLYGTALAINGYVEGSTFEAPHRLPRTIAFASQINRSEWFVKTLNDNRTLKSQVTKRLPGDTRAMQIEAVHLDASSSALERAKELRLLNDTHRQNESRMICNVRLFTEGVDVPSLDAVSFLDPRTSQIDIVQAVGRVMRKSEGKLFGYIIVPVCIPEGASFTELLAGRSDDYRHIGQVLRALQSHDERLADATADFVTVQQTVEPDPDKAPRDESDRDPEVREVDEPEDPDRQLPIELEPVETGIYTHIAAASGLGKPGQATAMTIADAVTNAARRFADDAAIISQAKEILELPAAPDKEIATVAALLLCNACLLHKRLKSDTEDMATLVGLDEIARADEPIERLSNAWEEILVRDYEPIFRPALAILRSLPRNNHARKAIQVLAECSSKLADSLNELGYDHAGPLYHSILGSAESDGAFYTNNISALMLAGLALSPELVDWSNREAATSLRILDPACGTGTLLMAAIKTIKDRGLEGGAFTSDDLVDVHKKLVEESIRGLDINYHATQLAASNLTLGAPTVDYNAMHIHTLQHGPQSDDQVKLGSLELLPDAVADIKPDLLASTKNPDVDHGADNIDTSRKPDISNLDVILMNPPFTKNDKRASRYPPSVKREMQARELWLKDQVSASDKVAGKLIDVNSVRTFFTPLAEALLNQDTGILAEVLPTTACTSTSGLIERRFLANRFHIKMIVTSHDPKHSNFSENTSIHESLLICCRKTPECNEPTLFISLGQMPSESSEAFDWLENVHSGRNHSHQRTFSWPRERIAEGDWTPAQYYDGHFAQVARDIDTNPLLTPLGNLAFVEPTGRRIRDAFVNPLQNEVRKQHPILWTHQTDERRTMQAVADHSTEPKPSKEHYATQVLWPKASRLLIAFKIRAQTIRTAAVLLPSPALGHAWVPITPKPSIKKSVAVQKAWCAYLNSTLGAISLLNRRQKTLDYADYSLEQLRQIPCPDPTKANLQPLVEAFDTLQDKELLPWPRMDQCPIRAKLDEAAAMVAGIDIDTIADWRKRLVQEPTISNSRPSALREVLPSHQRGS